MILRPTIYDFNGHVFSPQWYTANKSAGAVLCDAARDVSHGKWPYARYTEVDAVSDAEASSGDYATAYDALEMIFAVSGGRARVRVLINAPVTSLFQGDGETFDASGNASLVSAFLGNATDPSGRALADIISGRRVYLTPAR